MPLPVGSPGPSSRIVARPSRKEDMKASVRFQAGVRYCVSTALAAAWMMGFGGSISAARRSLSAATFP